MKTYIYALAAAEHAKFGLSSRPELRRISIASDVGIDFELVGAIPGNLHHEVELHDALAPYRVAGEFYRRCDAVDRVMALFAPYPLARIETIRRAKSAPTGDAATAKGFLQELCDRRNTLQHEWLRLSKQLGMNERRVRSIWHGEARAILASEMDQLRNAASALRGAVSHQIEEVTA